MIDGHNILHLRYGEVKDWCLTPRDKDRKILEIGTDNVDSHEFVEGKEAVDRLVEIIDEKHEKEDFGHGFDMAETALKEMLENCYGLEIGSE